MVLETGQTVERFTVEAKLGEGGMAAVYRVRHNTLGSYHALKLLKVANPDIKRRLVEEGRVQASLHHPNIVAVTDVLVVDGQPGLLMELVDGPTLEEWLWSNRPTLEQAEALFRGVVAGVGRAHRAGLVHRDLKPGNILLDVADGMVIPKVTDFGLAKILADEDGGHSQTRSGVTLGTPQFMAPEQIRNAKSVDQRAAPVSSAAEPSDPAYTERCGVASFPMVTEVSSTPSSHLLSTAPEAFSYQIQNSMVQLVSRSKRSESATAT